MKNTSTNSGSGFAASLFLSGALTILLTSMSMASPTMVQPMPQNITFSGLNDSLAFNGANNVREYYFDFSYLPDDKQVLDVDVRISMTHTYTQDVHMFLVSPSGVEIPVFEVGGCLGMFPLNTIFDDEGLASGTCGDMQIVERVQPIQFPGFPGAYLSGFDGQHVSGIWTLRIADLEPTADGGVVFEVGLEIVVDLPVMAGRNLAPREHAGNGGTIKLVRPDLDLQDADQTAEFMLFQNEPNPFHNTTMITYILPAPQNVTLTVFDITGRTILIKQQESYKGRNSLTVQAAEISAAGVLYYRLDTNGFSATKKMLMVN